MQQLAKRVEMSLGSGRKVDAGEASGLRTEKSETSRSSEKDIQKHVNIQRHVTNALTIQSIKNN